MDITLDLDLTAANLKENLERFLQVLPDDLLMQVLERVASYSDIGDVDAKELMSAALTVLVVTALRGELDRRALKLKGLAQPSTPYLDVNRSPEPLSPTDLEENTNEKDE